MAQHFESLAADSPSTAAHGGTFTTGFSNARHETNIQAPEDEELGWTEMWVWAAVLLTIITPFLIIFEVGTPLLGVVLTYALMNIWNVGQPRAM